MIFISDISFSYKNKSVLSNISLSITEQDCIILRGNSGVGKTTLLKIISGLLIPKSGKVIVDDEDIYEKPEEDINSFRSDHISYLSQSTNLIDSLTVLDNIILPQLLMKNKNIDELKENALMWLNYVNLSGYGYKQPSTLSGGEKRRVEIARSLCSSCKYLVMDEPTNSLDDECVNAFCELINKMIKDNKTLIISTHDNRLVHLATKTVIIENTILRSVE